MRPTKSSLANEAEANSKIRSEEKTVPYYRLYRFLSPKEKLWLGIAFLSSLIASAGLPALNLLLGEMAELVVNDNMAPLNCTRSEGTVPSASTRRNIQNTQRTLQDQMTEYSIYMAVVGVIQIVTGYVFLSTFCRLAEIQVYRLRVEYLEALLRQNISWYDTVEDSNFVAKITENVSKVREAIGENAAMSMYFFLSSFLCLVIAFWYGWLLTLVVLATAPVVALSTAAVATLQSKLTSKEQKAYSKAGTVAQEALSNIKTVMAFSGQKKEMERYERRLVLASRAGRCRGIVSAFGNGFLWFLNYATYSLVFWYGTKLIFDGRKEACTKTPEYDTAALTVVFFNILIGSFNFGQALSYLEVFSVGCGAATAIYKVIDRNSEIDSYNDSGECPNERLKGKIEFKNITFSYPSRKGVIVLDRINLDIQPGTTVALVGSSGCGKSTCLQLLQRFYDPDDGSVLVDGMNIKDLNIRWYRSQLGVVSQEPVLFNTSIAENVRSGKEGATQSEIEEACKLSNAHMFISRLPKKYDTVVGERGAQLSGGQKQRIAIARALVRNPPILILDEATSALDTQSEAIVQEALDRASKGRTTLIVAHRLSTIRNADVIIAIKNAKVVEVGTHENLMAKEGFYYHLVFSQTGGRDGSLKDETELNSRKPSLEPLEDQLISEMLSATEIMDKNLAKRANIFSLLRLNSKESGWILTGFLMSALQGMMLPLDAYLYGRFMGVLSKSDYSEAQEEANVYGLYYLALGVYAFLTVGIGLSCFCVSGEALTNRLRKLSFETMLNLDVAWYDNPKNNVGGLCTQLSGDAAFVQGATGTRLGIVAQAFTTIAISAAMALYGLPKLGAVALAFVPFILVANVYMGKMLEKQQMEENVAMEEASSYAFQAVSSIRTVASLGKEREFVEMYSKSLLPPRKKAVANSHLLGLVFGLSQGSLFFAYAAVFYYGAYLIQSENVDYTQVFVIAEALVSAMLELGQTLAFAPCYNKAKIAGGRILSLLDTKPSIISRSGASLQEKCKGNVRFDNVEFSYPERKGTKVLKGLSLGVEPLKHVGICGPSGSGKSTCIQLILRYYDPASGKVLLDGTDISTLSLDALRSEMAIVAQEPALFDRSLAENIAYGDNARDVSMTKIIEAAKAANIHEFITSLPSGYSTRVGEMGAQLSGGQKQRVAIARALVRKPKLLLLDEATSALDAESEAVVQAALDNASKGRTCITIAHRLSSIQGADTILVITDGALSESGTHAELLQRRGLYHKLWNMQNHLS